MNNLSMGVCRQIPPRLSNMRNTPLFRCSLNSYVIWVQWVTNDEVYYGNTYMP